MFLIENLNFYSCLWLSIIIIGWIGIWFHQRLKTMSILKRNGIPVNIPHLIFGNFFEMKGLSMVERQNRLIEKYGKIVGSYTGAKPNILVADPELAKRILIKDFHNFKNRSVYLKYSHPFPETASSLFFARYKRWKKMRSLLSPVFSAHKLRGMTPLLESSVDSFLQIIRKKSETGEEFNIHELYQRLTVETIMRTAFGVEIDGQNDNNSELVLYSRLFLEQKFNKYVVMLFMCFPEVAEMIQFFKGISQPVFNLMGKTPVAFLLKTCSQIIRLRRGNPNMRRNDLLQAMLDSKVSGRDISDVLSVKINNNDQDCIEIPKNRDNNENQIHLTEDDIKINCSIFLAAGSDTTSTGLAFVTHFLLNYPEIQERVRTEIIEVYKNEGKLDYNTITKLEYMEWVINETFRINPPVFNTSTRECAADYKYKNIIIPKGTTVTTCTHFLHNDPDNWSEPEKFDPMRFSPERRQEIKPGTWQPFGDGPRNCIGTRLAYLNMKLTLAKLLLEYRLETGPNTEIGRLSTKSKTFAILVPKRGVFLKTIKII